MHDLLDLETTLAAADTLTALNDWPTAQGSLAGRSAGHQTANVASRGKQTD